MTRVLAGVHPPPLLHTKILPKRRSMARRRPQAHGVGLSGIRRDVIRGKRKSRLRA